MRGTSAFFETQVDLCGRQAADALLSNQRDMFLRAQAAWQVLADKETRVQAEREKRSGTPALA
jgi:hypothetical protein